jgi:hypothetical protein
VGIGINGNTDPNASDTFQTKFKILFINSSNLSELQKIGKYRPFSFYRWVPKNVTGTRDFENINRDKEKTLFATKLSLLAHIAL